MESSFVISVDKYFKKWFMKQNLFSLTSHSHNKRREDEIFYSHDWLSNPEHLIFLVLIQKNI